MMKFYSIVIGCIFVLNMVLGFDGAESTFVETEIFVTEESTVFDETAMTETSDTTFVTAIENYAETSETEITDITSIETSETQIIDSTSVGTEVSGETTEFGIESVETTVSKQNIVVNKSSSTISKKQESAVNMLNFFFTPYETGPTNNDAVKVGILKNAVSIGILDYTTTENYSGIQRLCSALSSMDSEFAGSLKKFSNWSNSQVIEDMSSSDSLIITAFEQLDTTNHKKFVELQMQTAESEIKKIMEKTGVKWILNRSSAFIGTYYSLLVWAPGYNWEEYVDPEKNDRENMISLYIAVSRKIPEDGYVKFRWEAQFETALKILDGTINKDNIWNFIENLEF